MGGPYYVDDGGDGSDGLTWAKAYTSINALDAAVTLASGEIVYFGHNHVCQAENSAHLTITGPASGAPVIFISATQGSDPPTYAVATTTTQIDTSEGAYNCVFDGSFALYGISVNCGAYINILPDLNEVFYAENCKFLPAANSYVSLEPSKLILNNCTIDGSNDGTTGRSSEILRTAAGTSMAFIYGMNFTNVAYRTGSVIRGTGSGTYTFSGCDFSGFTNGTTCELFGTTLAGILTLNNCKTKASPTLFDATAMATSYSRYEFYNVQAADDPTHLVIKDYFGDLVSCPAAAQIYRTGGATIEEVATSWLVTTNAVCTKDSPFYSPWIYGTIASTGNKTFTVYITNDTADLNNDDVWLQVEYMDSADVGLYTLVTDKPATRLTAAGAQTDDTTSTWNGTGPSFTYKQSLANAAAVSVDETGQFRVRVVVGKASIAAASYFYIDPKVTVS